MWQLREVLTFKSGWKKTTAKCVLTSARVVLGPKGQEEKTHRDLLRDDRVALR